MGLWGVIRNQFPKIHRSKVSSTVGDPFRTISKIDCRVIYHARFLLWLNNSFSFQSVGDVLCTTIPSICVVTCSHQQPIKFSNLHTMPPNKTLLLAILQQTGNSAVSGLYSIFVLSGYLAYFIVYPHNENGYQLASKSCCWFSSRQGLAGSKANGC